MRIPKPVVAAIAVAATAAAAPPAHAAAQPTHTENARQGAVRAAYSFRATLPGSTYVRARLKIWNGARLIVNHPIQLTSHYAAIRELSVRQLDGAGPPEVVLNQYSGGAHCCSSTWIYTGAHRVVKDWFHSPPVLRDVDGDGIPEFHGADSGFAYAFGSFASSGFPAKVWRYTGTAVIDVSRAFPAEVQADMAQQYARYQAAVSGTSPEGARGALAAYAADGYTLGQGDPAMAVVQSAVDAGQTGTAMTETDPFWQPDFMGRLRDLLHRLGYA
jgi:hypothetical protein